MPKVFVSYSHDSEDHKERVLALSNRLRREGVDCLLDRYESFPPEGWPRWMAAQISSADYVLVVCTEKYARRAEAKEIPGLGLGATWEGQLITQQIYENGGRNRKFVPVFFEDADAKNIPDFLRPSTRFHVGKQAGYEELYRLLTEQPAALKPTLGEVRVLPTDTSFARTMELNNLVDKSRTFSTLTQPIVVWRLPRGFVVFENLEYRSNPTWAVVASYYAYSGDCLGATHYHESYRWMDSRRDALKGQYQKLGIPEGDWLFTQPAIAFMVNVREGLIAVSEEGTLSDPSALDEECATIHPPGPVGFPTRPAKYRPLAISGRMRDHVAHADGLLLEAIQRGRKLPDFGGPDLEDQIRRLRRVVRIEVHRLLSETHPATKNLDEVIERFDSRDPLRHQWLSELRDASWEAVRCIEEQTE